MPLGRCVACAITWEWEHSPRVCDARCLKCGGPVKRTTRKQAESAGRIVSCVHDRRPFPHNAPGGWNFPPRQESA